MKRLKDYEKRELIRLIKEGKSLNYIRGLMKRRKSTLYHYYKKIMGKKLSDVRIDKYDDLFMGELIGLFVGDGGLYYDKIYGKYRICFFFNFAEKEYVNNLTSFFEEKFNKKPNVYRSKNVLIVRYYSKKLFMFLKEHVGWDISKNLIKKKKSRSVFLKKEKYSREFKKGFLRGFIDSDGYFSQKKILFGSTSEKIMKQTEGFLTDLSYKYYKLSFYKDKRREGSGIWHLYVHKCERNKFLKDINPRNITKCVIGESNPC